MDQQELVQKAKEIAAQQFTPEMDVDEKEMLLEMAMMKLLDVAVVYSPLGHVANLASGWKTDPYKSRVLMGDDPRLPKMPAKPTLIDFFKNRILLHNMGGQHLLQSANLARGKGLPEKLVMACLLHDISVIGFIRCDHGYWASQLVAPYVDEEVAWAIRYHQSLRYFPDKNYNYEYPPSYLVLFGEDYQVPEYIRKDAEYAKSHKWYDSAMQICLNDLYAFDPNKKVEIEEFEGIIARNFKTPKEGLGFDKSPVAHMWRTMIWPCNFL